MKRHGSQLFFALLAVRTLNTITHDIKLMFNKLIGPIHFLLGLFDIFTHMLSSIYKDAYEKAVQMYERGDCREEILGFLVLAAERASGPDSVASILLLDENGLLRNGSSPKLPADYLHAIDGIKPHPNVGTCAAAAATGLPVVTPSFYADNKWAELRHLPTALGFVGAWSMPIKNGGDQVLGTFGTYFRQQREPSAEEMKGVELLASAVAQVLVRKIAGGREVQET